MDNTLVSTKVDPCFYLKILTLINQVNWCWDGNFEKMLDLISLESVIHYSTFVDSY